MNADERLDLEFHAEQAEYSRRYDTGHRAALKERLRELYKAACRHHDRLKQTETLGRMGTRDMSQVREDEMEVEKAAMLKDQLEIILRGFWR